MKSTLTFTSLSTVLLTLGTLCADEKKPVPTTPAPAPAPPIVVGKPPAPATPPVFPTPPAAPQLDPADTAAFKTPEERRNYALGAFLAMQLENSGDPNSKPNLEEVEAGLKAGLSGEKSANFISGANIGSNLKRDDIKVDLPQVMAALGEVLKGGTPKLSQQGLQIEMRQIQDQINARRMEKMKAEGATNLKDASAFLEKNGKADGVTTTPSGLQFKVLKSAKGEKPAQAQLVKVNFVSTMLNGKEVDRTPPDKPRVMPQMGTKGWMEAIGMMEIGSKYQFWIPPALGYGENGQMPKVRPNALLIYEVELVGIEAAPVSPPPSSLSGATNPIPVPGAGGPPKAPRQPISATTPPVGIELPKKPEPGKGDNSKEPAKEPAKEPSKEPAKDSK